MADDTVRRFYGLVLEHMASLPSVVDAALLADPSINPQARKRLMVPYRGGLNPARASFNEKVGTVRTAVERGFGSVTNT